MKLAKALKLKNRIAGDIAQAQKLISAANVTESGNVAAHDVEALLKELIDNQNKLVKLKAQIAAANLPITEKIIEMGELKARIAFLRAIPTKDGTFFMEGRYGAEPRQVAYHATIKAARVESDIRKLSERIDALQDEVDTYNATTSI